jgi:hypothetical protein
MYCLQLRSADSIFPETQGLNGATFQKRTVISLLYENLKACRI